MQLPFITLLSVAVASLAAAAPISNTTTTTVPSLSKTAAIAPSLNFAVNYDLTHNGPLNSLMRVTLPKHLSNAYSKLFFGLVSRIGPGELLAASNEVHFEVGRLPDGSVFFYLPENPGNYYVVTPQNLPSVVDSDASAARAKDKIKSTTMFDAVKNALSDLTAVALKRQLEYTRQLVSELNEYLKEPVVEEDVSAPMETISVVEFDVTQEFLTVLDDMRRLVAVKADGAVYSLLMYLLGGDVNSASTGTAGNYTGAEAQEMLDDVATLMALSF